MRIFADPFYLGPLATLISALCLLGALIAFGWASRLMAREAKREIAQRTQERAQERARAETISDITPERYVHVVFPVHIYSPKRANEERTA